MRHTSMGPSSWDRWIRCPASVVASQGIPDDPSYEALEGTVFHHLVAVCLKQGLDPYDWIGSVMDEGGVRIEFDQQMAESAQDGMEIIQRLMDDPDWTVLVEKEVDISPWAGFDEMGTVDVLAWSVIENRIIIFDWKYGRGVPVYPASSYQLRGYALGAWNSFIYADFVQSGLAFSPEEIIVDLMIEQPRISAAGGTYQTTMANLLAFGQLARKAQKRVRLGFDNPALAEFNPGEKQCEWCRAQTTCRAHAVWILDAMGLEFEDLDKVDVSVLLSPDMTPERRSAVLRMWPVIKKWHDNLHASAYHDAKMGRPVPGLKLAQGRRSKRIWKSDYLDYGIVLTHLIELVGAEIALTKPEPLSVASAERVLGKKRFSATLREMVQERESKLVLVSDYDDRAAVGSIVEEFDILP